MLSGAGQPPISFLLCIFYERRKKRGMILRSWLNEQKSGSYPTLCKKLAQESTKQNRPVEMGGTTPRGAAASTQMVITRAPGAKITQHHYPRTSLECCVIPPYEGGAVGNDCIKARECALYIHYHTTTLMCVTEQAQNTAGSLCSPSALSWGINMLVIFSSS